MYMTWENEIRTFLIICLKCKFQPIVWHPCVARCSKTSRIIRNCWMSWYRPCDSKCNDCEWRIGQAHNGCCTADHTRLHRIRIMGVITRTVCGGGAAIAAALSSSPVEGYGSQRTTPYRERPCQWLTLPVDLICCSIFLLWRITQVHLHREHNKERNKAPSIRNAVIAVFRASLAITFSPCSS